MSYRIFLRPYHARLSDLFTDNPITFIDANAPPCPILPRRESEKKQPAARHKGHSLEAFRDRLRDLCGHDLEGAGHDRARLAQD
jgi:hypothetical protein